MSLSTVDNAPCRRIAMKDIILDEPTKQTIFDTVFEGLYKQGHRSVDGVNGGCVYRALDGSKCAVGLLITPEYYETYQDTLEGNSIMGVLDEGLLPSLKPFDLFVEALQNVHDIDLTPTVLGVREISGVTPELFRKELIRCFRTVAYCYGIDDMILDLYEEPTDEAQ
jgi:hypothetical protein